MGELTGLKIEQNKALQDKVVEDEVDIKIL